jgi:PAS domain S-box-containing protein
MFEARKRALEQPIIRYTLAVAIPSVALLIRHAIEQYVVAPLPTFITVYPAVMLVALLAGFWPGLLATLISALLTDYWFLPPLGQFKIERPADAIALALFCAMGVFMSAVAELYRGNRRKAEAYQKELAERESRVLHRLAMAAAPNIMEAKQFKTLLRRAVVIPVLLLAILGGALLWEVHHLTTALRWVDHTDVVLANGRKLLRLVVDGETGLRGYLLTGSQEFLQPYRASEELSPGQYRELENLVADDPPQQARLAAMQDICQQWHQYAARMIDARRAGNYNDVVLNLQGKRLMDSIRAQQEQFVAVEEQLRGERTDAALRASRLTIASSLALTLGVGLFLGIFTRRQTQSLAGGFQKSLEVAGASAGQLRLALEAAELGAWDYHFPTGDVFWDERCRLMFGVAEGKRIDYEAAIAHIHAEDRPGTDEAVKLAIAGADGGAYHREFRVVWPDGSQHWVASHGRVYFDDEGDQRHAVRFVGVNTDITERKRAEEALRQSEERWVTTLRSIGDAVISTDGAGRIIFMNDVAQKLTGWPLSEAQGKDLDTVFNIVNEFTRAKPESPVAKVIRLGSVIGLANHTALISRAGTEFAIDDSAAPIRDRDGQIEGVVLVFHDISDQKKAENALRTNERLATAGRLAATLAHEIHNPLDAVGNLLYLIDQTPDLATIKEFVAKASGELTRVTQMTRNMLAFQREASKPVPVKIEDILDNVVMLYKAKIDATEIQLSKQNEFDGEFLALPGEIRQVVANLVGNAIEALGGKGKIRLHAYPAQEWCDGRRGLRVVVADNGPGISPEVSKRIFDPFFTTKGERGTGLGLWITAGIIEKYEGTIRLRSNSRAGRSGTCFSVFFPRQGD